MTDSDAISEVIAELMRTREELQASELFQIGNAQKLLSLIDVCLDLISRLSVQISRTAELSTSGFSASTDAFIDIKGRLDLVLLRIDEVDGFTRHRFAEASLDAGALMTRVSDLEHRLRQVIDAVGT